ncbi:MAG: serine/threonine protein kinase [Planctomycetaceae bacterium]|nr:serine/threonine protein kinase [Planctomycetaceae bacterium]
MDDRLSRTDTAGKVNGGLHTAHARSGPTEMTLEAPSDSSLSCVGPACKVHLVQGSGTELSGETENLLRSRLRSAALLLFAGFAAFLIWHITRINLATGASAVLFVLHCVTTVVLGLIAISLSSRCPMTTRQLRWVELVTFGLPVVFTMLLQHSKAIVWAEWYGVIPPISCIWLLQIFLYALFIPNTWKRAAVVLGLIAAAPLVSVAISAWLDPNSAQALTTDPQFIIEAVLVLTLATVSSIWGVYTINSLRTEAFRAKELGQYKLKRLIGSGGMGDVYLGEHQLMKRPCAIKVIRPEKAGDPKVLARFEREVQATAKLSHWNSIDIFDYGRAEDGTFYYVMEYLPGMNLSELVRRYGPMPAARAIHLLRQACDALHEAHDVGLVHRDIKPANIFAAVRGGLFDVAKLLDFGLAKPVANIDGDQITQEGTITGSPLYMSPEQAVGDHEPDARSDIYAMGAVLYFILTGRPPFEDEKPMRVLIAHAHDAPTPPSQLNSDVPEDVELVVMRCLQKSADDRYQTAAELMAALDDCEDAGRWTRDAARAWWHQNERQAAAASESEMVAG